ncbi:MAG: vanadium-dependent haloperoxidase [Saprospirales bacterium]|jgi:hypothetical protein|nr:vanadium-dependent haloperoxidase [Saprospirales bacterium]
MNRYLVILCLWTMTTAAALAQQSNKSKSKDRYREKDQPAMAEVNDAIDRYGALRAVAEQELRPVTFALSEVMLHDVASPPSASRYFAYALLAGYETMARYQSRVSSLHEVLPGLPLMLSFVPADSVFYPFASLWAILETGKQMMPSGYMLAGKQRALEGLFREKGLSDAYIKHSKAAANDIVRLVLEYAGADGFSRLTAYAQYRPAANDPAAWAPTPPDWMEAIDPRWNTLRPFLAESARQFQPPPAAPYDPSPGSDFMGLVKEVYAVSNSLTAEQRAIAEFWDCNPFAVQHAGHMAIGIKKISPGGHWMNICGLVCEQQKTPFGLALNVHTALALALADAFISCWDEKYRSNRVRPVTVINRLIDPKWEPVLQTPPFPEYSSGHSTVSAAAAEVLTHFLGDNIAFLDNSEALYGIKPRQFRSFRQAAREASISRLYGGIHFRDALDQGLAAGGRLGTWVVSRWPKEQ